MKFIVLLFLSLIGTASCLAKDNSQQLGPEYFSQLPQYNRLSLSPDGKQLAFVRNFQDPEFSVLATMDTNGDGLKYLVRSDNEEIKIKWFKWANNKTLIVSVRFADRRHHADTTETRLLAIDVDQQAAVQRVLIKPRSNHILQQHLSQFQDNVIDMLPNDPEHILLALDLDIANMPSVYKLNIYTLQKSRLEKGKSNIRDWMSDQQGRLRLGESLSYKDGEASLRIRLDVNDDTWTKKFAYNALQEPGVTPLGFALDPNFLYYSAYQGDKKALYKMDLSLGKSELVYLDENYDVDGSLIYSTKSKEVIGIRHPNSPDGRIIWDEDRINFQQALNAVLPDTTNYLVDFSQDENTYLLYAENDSTPGMYYVGNRNKNALNFLFEQYPGLSEQNLSEHQLVAYTARDGSTIEGYLTLPKGINQPIATILHPHGGPGARDMDGFDYWTAFFNSLGYGVFRPNFRGSSGYGYEFAQSQMRGWGLTMQDDLTDATQWLIEQKIADPQRICIVGASYGGYAAAMAAVKTPELFTCAISFAGVSDLKMLVNASRRYLNNKFVKNQIGSDADDLEARSPYHQADKIQIPILLLHGEDDRVVDVEHSRRLSQELEDLDKQVEYIEFAKGDHYLSLQHNRHKAFKAMQVFLQQHLN